MELRGAVAVVTGASAGIGRSTAIALAGAGATVVASARREDRLREVVEDIRTRGGEAMAIASDVADREQVLDLARGVHEAHGRCDVLVNNAGVPGGGAFPSLSWEQVERVVDINYLGVLSCTNAFLPAMLAAGRGHIVNVASLAGRFALPGSSVYSSTKHAVVAFSEALHYEVEPRGVRVTSVNPGLVATEAFPHRDAIERGRKVLSPDRIAELILEVVKRGRAPEVSIPRSLAALQIVRLLVPPLYRFALKRAARGTIRPTRVGEA
jgi:short-subunit dehydrogenase